MQNNTFSGLFVGQNLITLKEVASTNTFLKDALSKSTPLLEGTVIMAEKQFAGRGQTDNTWLSEERMNLTFSILLNPSFLRVDQQFEFNKAISVALIDVLGTYVGDDALIKWPNDLYIGGRKTGGMLIENIVTGNKIKHAIVGIGLNVNQTNFPVSLKNVTSLKQRLHKDYDLLVLLGEICSAIEARYLQLKAGHTKKISLDYMNSLYLLNQRASFKTKDGFLEGKIIGVNSSGQLEMETPGGRVFFNNKEVEFIYE
ncbi:biotin--[acetyl-CoA-carboxylase] ligase [Daejeonella lutea]|uniref:BirA family transcriptional regulator, biotin operon repressor / biotin-[acetyl-CoA-carboxylase] ligase n=1 Tax=Daejeonella lutea TaxID=572036 RepID=A0A1T5DNH3_9SPHI|nr:biotin--[acetyl-CoA-carboxylase] ligase [Daejeonella lutea]SKB73257.1 BirA family transcriptional regulator, biotin operon repressor / biotin-[acetyl-CoA-carboxylase] ligase [Daejeonella lutea]